jgi:hypothetical protein
MILKLTLIAKDFIWQHGHPQTFFQGRAKIFQGGGQEPTFCLKNNEKDTIFPKKVYKLFLAGLGRPGGGPPPLALPCGRPYMATKITLKRRNSIALHILKAYLGCSM